MNVCYGRTFSAAKILLPCQCVVVSVLQKCMSVVNHIAVFTDHFSDCIEQSIGCVSVCLCGATENDRPENVGPKMTD